MMPKKKERKIIYYQDELNDEFSTAKIIPKKIDENYQYIHHSFFKKITHFFWYRVIATPLAFFYLKITFRHKIVNKKILKQVSKDGYFLYGNHTQIVADALIPTMITSFKDAYVIVHPNNVSMPYLGRITPSLGALPLPDTKEATKNFIHAIEERLKQKKAIVIYPEAHIWPYYTKIRPFVNTSFCYPIRYDKPTFCFTNTYQKRKHSQKVKIVTYIDGPFYADKTKNRVEQRQDLRNQVYDAMVKRSLCSNVEVIRYERRKEND